MTKEEKYELAKWAMTFAREKGAQEAGVSIYDSISSSVDVREGKIDKLEQANECALSIRLLVENRFSAHSTNRLDNREELKRFISGAIAATRFLSEDEFRHLPDPELYYKGGGEDLKTFDNNFSDVEPGEKIDIALGVEKEIAGTDNRIISVTASYSDGLGRQVMVTSNGFEGDSENTSFGLTASVTVKGGDARPESYWSENAIFFDQLIREGIGKKALERALGKIGQSKITSGKMEMLVENRNAARLLSPVISALSGAAIQQRNSFLAGRINSQVASGKLTIIDDPFIVSGRGSRYFDGEGLETKRRKIFDHGYLRNYYINTYYGRKLGMEPTSGSNTNLIIEAGDKSFDDLAASMKKGIIVTGFNGGNSNGSTGDYSFGIDGFLVEDGVIVKPVSEMNISGNMKQLWMDLAETGNDPYLNSSWRIPSMLFKNVDFSGI